MGKEHHHVAAVSQPGQVVYSQKVASDEPALRHVIAEVTALAGEVRWAAGMKDGAAALLALLATAGAQIVYVPGRMVHRMSGACRGEGKTDAKDVMALNERIRQIDERIAARFRCHRSAAVITSLPGIGPLPGAEFLGATGGDMTAFTSADHLAGYAGLAPAPRDSRRRTGNLSRPKRYNRALNRVFCTSAQASILHAPESRAFYDRKRAEGKEYTQAVLALARRRVNVLWAMLRGGQPYTAPAPATAIKAA